MQIQTALSGSNAYDRQQQQRQQLPYDAVSAGQNLPQPLTAPVAPASANDSGFEFPRNDQERLELVRQAAGYYAAQMPAGDLKFTLFRDADGQIITRFRNMVDGTVTEVPEPQLVPSYVRSALGRANLVNLVS